jgi:ABC-2 type transport system permease protein
VNRALRAEALKLATVRLPFGLLAIAAGLTAGLALLTAANAGGGGPMAAAPLSTASGLTSVIGTGFLAMTMATVFGVTVSTAEFRHSTITATYLATPGRARVLATKLLAGFAFGLVFGAVGSAVSTGVALAFSTAKGYHVALGAGTLLRYTGGAVLGSGLLAAAGVSLGALIKSQLGAVVTVLLWQFLIENTVGGLYHPVARFLPFEAATSLAGSAPPGGTALPFALAVILLTAVALTIGAAAARTTVRADVA